MDPTFQALLFSKPTTARGDAAAPSSAAGINASDPGRAAKQHQQQQKQLTRASRYARLIPREALRITEPAAALGSGSGGGHDGNNSKKHKKKPSSSSDENESSIKNNNETSPNGTTDDDNNDSTVKSSSHGGGEVEDKKKKKKHDNNNSNNGANSGEDGGSKQKEKLNQNNEDRSTNGGITSDDNDDDRSGDDNYSQAGSDGYELGDDGNIRVYRRNSNTGQLELLDPESDYDLVYFDDDLDNENLDGNEDGGNNNDANDGGNNDGDAHQANVKEESAKAEDAAIENAAKVTEETTTNIKPEDLAEAMDVDGVNDSSKDDKEETSQPQQQPQPQVSDEDEQEQEDVIYIVRDPPSSSNRHDGRETGSSSNKSRRQRRQRRRYNENTFGSTSEEEEDDIGSYSSSSSLDDHDDDNEGIDFGNEGNYPIDPTSSVIDTSAREVTQTTSTLARVLARRVEGFDKLRPRYGLEGDNDVDEKNKSKKGKKDGKDKEKEKKKDAKADGKKDKDKGGDSAKKSGSSATPGGSASDKDKASKSTSPSTPTKKKVGGNETNDGNTSDIDDNEHEDSEFLQYNQQQHLKGHKILQSLPPSSKVTDGDDPTTLMKLSKMSIWQERHLPPEMHGVEMNDWEDGIDWEGGVDSDDERASKPKVEKSGSIGKSSGGIGGGSDNAVVKMDTDATSTFSGTKSDVDFEVDCTEDFHVDEYHPPIPEGGYPKRQRYTPTYTDACQLLFQASNPRMDALDLDATIDWEGGISGDEVDDDDDSLSNSIPLILQSSIAGQSVATQLAPCPSSRPLSFESHPNYQQRAEREMASDITSTANLSSGLESEALEKFKEMRQKKREQMAKDKQSRVKEVMSTLGMGGGTGRRITSSLMGPGGAERTGRPSRHAMGSTSAHDAEYVEQLELVYNHSLVKPELTLSEYRQFHRPRLPLAVVNPKVPWQFQTRVITTEKKGKRGAVITAADGSTVVGSYHAMMSAGAKAQNKIRNEADLSPSMGDLLIIEYSEERPLLFMTKGMTCRIVNYYRGDRSRCPVSAGGGDRPLRKRHGDKAASAQGAEPAGPTGRIERPPRLFGPNQYCLKSAADLIGVVSSAKKKKSKEVAAMEAKKSKETAIDVLPEGVTEILHPKVHGPFIGEVEEGKTQTGLISNLFAAPMFRHDSEPTDFLMVLGQVTSPSSDRSTSFSDSSNQLGVALRPLPANIYCVGQTEPRVKVFSPNTNDEKKFINAFIPYQVAKNLHRTEEYNGGGLTFEDIKDRLFANTVIPQTQLRIRIKQVATFERKDNGIWNLKKIGEDGFPGVEALGRKVSPEGVAAYESQCAGIRRLQDLGIKDLYSGGANITNLAMVMMYLNGAAHAAMERKLRMKKVLDIKKRQKSPQVPYFQRAFDKLDEMHKQVKKRQEIAKFIYEEIQLSPWHLSGEFIDVHKRAQGSAMMKLTGIGDPSGLGEAYSFLREQDNKPNKATVATNDGALNAQIKKITGTENDLRKLTMKQMASLLRSYGMKDKQIAVLKRWDRVHVIRDLSTKAASDGMGDELERFARGEKLRLSDQRQIYKERVQEIWRRQIAALTADPGNDVSRSESAIGSSKEPNEVEDASKPGADKEDSDDSDDDDDDFAAMLEMDMTSTGDANRLLAAQLNESGDSTMRTIGRSLDTQELSKDARELAALQRQREEERAMQVGLDKKSTLGSEETKRKKFKCIRRRITKTHPDGTQTVTFEFIVQRDKVEEIMDKMKKDELDKKKRAEKAAKKRKPLYEDDDEDNEQDTCVGHAMFEDEDTTSKGRRSLKLKIKKETRVIHKKATGSLARKASHSKLTSDSKYSKQAIEKKKKKRMRELEEEDLYKTHHRTKGTSNRKERGAARERMPHVIFANRLETIRAQVEARPSSHAFHKPVSRGLYPHYYEVISEPIDLATIKTKNEKFEYKDADQFLKDFDLMRKNAVKFNGKGSPLAVEATEIYEIVQSTIEQNRGELEQMAEAVRDQMNNSGRKKKKNSKASKKSDAKASSSSDAPMNTASIVLDGNATEVNLGGDLSMMFGDGSDSDSD